MLMALRLNFRSGILQVHALVKLGQETFRSIVSAYYNSADAIIIVYDTTSYRSF